METLLSVLVLVIVFGLLFWLVTLLPLPAPFGQIAQALMVIICVFFLIAVMLGHATGVPAFRFR